MVDVQPIVTARLSIPHAYAFRPAGNPMSRVMGLVRPGGGTVHGVCLAFALRHSEAGTILVDTGLHPDALRSLRSDFGVPKSVMFRGLKPAGEPFDAQLRALDIDADEVGRVVMTHLHVDHTSGMRLLPRAEFVCSRDEWRAATGSGAGARGFVSDHLPPESRMRLVDFEADGEPHGPFARTIDLLGDGSVRLVSTPGHTPGHLSVLLSGPGRPPVLLVGDAAYTLRNIEEQRLPLLTAGDKKARRSLGEIRSFADENPDAVLVPSHDPSAYEALLGTRARA